MLPPMLGDFDVRDTVPALSLALLLTAWGQSLNPSDQCVVGQLGMWPHPAATNVPRAGRTVPSQIQEHGQHASNTNSRKAGHTAKTSSIRGCHPDLTQ